MIGRRKRQLESVGQEVTAASNESRAETWSDFESWLFRTVTGVYHTDPTSGNDAVFDMFFIETDDEGRGIIVTPETAADEMEKLRDVFGEQYPHIFEAAIPTQEG